MPENLKILTTVGSEAEAAMVLGRLREAGIRCMEQASGRGAQWNPGASIEIYVEEDELASAREALAPPAESEE